jgi:hypothetical protein
VKVLPLWQPYASLVAHGRKQIETRDWPAQKHDLVGTRIAIQATKGVGSRKDGGGEPAFRARCASWPFAQVLAELGYAMPADLPRAAILATAVVDDCERMTHDWVEEIYGTRPVEYEFGNYDEGRYAWFLRDVVLLPEPVPFSGHQGVPEVDDELLGFARSHSFPVPAQMSLAPTRPEEDSPTC